MRKDFAIKYLTALELIERSQGATIKELQTALKCESERTVYRVLASLEDNGLAVYSELDVYGPTNQKRWKLLGSVGEHDRDALVQLDRKERLILSLALQNTKLFEVGGLKGAIESIKWKLGRRGVIHSAERAGNLHVSLKRRKDYSSKEKIIRVILDAVEKREVCAVTYSALSTGLTKTYDIHPLTFMEHDNGLYLLAAIPKHTGSIRVLAVDRIKEMEAKPDHFLPPTGFNPEKLLAESFGIFIEEPLSVELLILPTLVPYIKERIWADNQTLEELVDGSVILRFNASGRGELKSWVLSLGSSVKVLGSKELLSMVKNELALANSQYT